MEVEGDLQWASTAVVNPTTEAALMQYPLTTIGDTPFAGLHLDPFNRDNPAAQPKPLDYLQFIVNNQVPQTYDLGRMLADPNATKR